MKLLKLGMLWGSGIGFTFLTVILLIVWLYEPDDISEFETAGSTSTAPPPDQPLKVALRPYQIKVLSTDGRTSLGFVSIRMVIGNVSHWVMVCRRLPEVREALALSLGEKVLSREEWFAVNGRAMANSLRKRFNKAIKANYVKKVIIDRGYRSSVRGESCSL